MAFMFGGGGSGSGSGSADASKGKGVSGTNENAEGTLYCGDSTIRSRTVKIESVTKDSDTQCTIQLDYRSIAKVVGYQFAFKFDDSLTITSPAFSVSERAGSGTPGFQISSPTSIGSNRFLVIGFLSAAGTFLTASNSDKDFLTIEVTTSNNAFAGLTSGQLEAKLSIVYANDNINTPENPTPVFAKVQTTAPKSDVWTWASGSSVVNALVDKIAEIYISGDTFDHMQWDKTSDLRLKGFHDITDVCSQKLYLIDGSKKSHDYVSDVEMLSNSDCTPCECPEPISAAVDCTSEISILETVTSDDGKEAVLTFGYKSTCRVSGYEIILDGLKSRTLFKGVGGIKESLFLDDQEAHKNEWMENIGTDPAISNSDRLTYSAASDRINTRIFGFSFGRMLHQNSDGTFAFGNTSSSTESWSLPSTGGKFKILTRVVVNLESFSSVPILKSFKLITNESLSAPANDYGNNWTGIDLNPFLGSTSHTTIGVTDLMACIYYYREGFGGAETSPYNHLNSYTQKFISETGRSELGLEDILAIGNHLTIKGQDATSDNTALIVPSDCCSVTLPGSFSLSGAFVACDEHSDPGKIQLTISASSNATGYKIYRRTNLASSGGTAKNSDSVLAKKLIRNGTLRAEDFKKTHLELVTTLSTHGTYKELPPVPNRSCSETQKATYYVVAFNSAGEVSQTTDVSYTCCDSAITTPNVSLKRVMNQQVEIFLPVTYNGAPAYFGSGDPAGATAELIQSRITSSPSAGGTFDLSFASEGKLLYTPPLDHIGKIEFTYTAYASSLPEGPQLSIENPGIIEMDIIPPIPNYSLETFACGDDGGKVLINITRQVPLGVVARYKIERKVSTDPTYSTITTLNSENFSGDNIVYVDEPGINDCCTSDVAYDYQITTTVESLGGSMVSDISQKQVTVPCCSLENVTNLATATTSCADASHPQVTVSWTATNTATSGKTVLRYVIYRKLASETLYDSIDVVVAGTNSYVDTSLPSNAGFASSTSYKYAVVTQATDGTMSGHPNHASWGTGVAGDRCHEGGDESTVAVPNCVKNPCPQDTTVEVCAGESVDVQLNYGCVIKEQRVGIAFAESAGGTAAGSLVTVDPSTGVATIDTTGISVGSYTQNFTVTDTQGNAGTGQITISIVDCECGCLNSDATYTICDYDDATSQFTTSLDQVPFSFPERPVPRGPNPPIILQGDGLVPLELPDESEPPAGGACSQFKITNIDASGLSLLNGGTSSVIFSVSGVETQDCAQKFYNLEAPHSIISSNFGNYFNSLAEFTTTWNSDYDEVTFSWTNSQLPTSSGGFRYMSLNWGNHTPDYTWMNWAFRVDSTTGAVDDTWGAGKAVADNNAIVSPPYLTTASGVSAFTGSNIWQIKMQGASQRFQSGPKWSFQFDDFVWQDNSFYNFVKSKTYFNGAVTMTIGGVDYYLIDETANPSGVNGIGNAAHRLNSQVTSGRVEYSPANVTDYHTPFYRSGTSGDVILGYYGEDDSGTIMATTSASPDNSTDVTFYFPANVSTSVFAGDIGTHAGAVSDLKIVISMADGTAGNMTMTAFRSDDGASWTEVAKIYPSGHDYA